MTTLALIVATGPLDVRRFVIREAVSEPWVVDVVALSPDPSLDLFAIIGRAATFRIESALEGARVPERRWEGVCRHAVLVQAEPTGLSTYRFEIVAALWLLTQRSDNRIFQHLRAHELAALVASRWLVESAAFAVDASAHPPLPFKVQYDESDYAFFSRVLEEEGIAFTFPPDDQGQPHLTLGDRLHAGPPREPIAYEAKPTHIADQEAISEVRFADEVRPGAFTLRDHDLRAPGFPLFAEAKNAPAPEDRLEQYLYRPGRFLQEIVHDPAGPPPATGTPAADDPRIVRHDLDRGKALAREGLDAARAGKRAIAYRTNVIDLWPGRVFHLAGHPHPALADATPLLAVELTIAGARDDVWTVRGRAVLADVPYRPPVRTPRPRARSQSAIVVGPIGEDIHTDEFGRVRVQFPWERSGFGDARASCWIRVSQGWAGPGQGMLMLPRVGQEVIVDFLDGDPEQPVVVGRLFNVANPPVERLPERATRSVWKSRSTADSAGFDALTMEDRKGSELFVVQAEKDSRRLVKQDDTSTTVRDRKKTVVGRELDWTFGNRIQETYSRWIELTERTHTVWIDGIQRDRVDHRDVDRIEGEEALFTAIDHHFINHGVERELIEEHAHLFIGGARPEFVGGNDSLTVGRALNEEVGSYSVAATAPDGWIHKVGGTKIVVAAGAEVTVKAGGGSFVDISGGSVFIVGPHVWINDSGAPGDLDPPGPARPERPEVAVVMDPGKATDTLVLEWPDALTAHLPQDLALRLELGARSTVIAWADAPVQDGRRRFVFEHVPLGAACTLTALAGGGELRLWDGQRANDPDDPPVFSRWIEDLIVREGPPAGRTVKLGPSSGD